MDTGPASSAQVSSTQVSSAQASLTHASATAAPSASRPEAQRGERRDAILHAAGRCFTCYGFHRTTMQMVAQEAGMSPGNIYRYFPSKNAIVEGMVERDREETRRRFAEIDRTQPFWGQFAELGRAYFDGDARARAMLSLEIWAEATRNPEIDAINRPFEAEAQSHLAELIESARARGEVAADIDPTAAAHVIMLITCGLYVRAGLQGEGGLHVDRALQAVYGLLTGAPVLREGADCGADGPTARAHAAATDSPQEPSA